VHQGQAITREITINLDHELLALTDVSDPRQAQAPEGSLNSSPLGVEDLRLEHDVDDDAGHGLSIASAGRRLGKGSSLSAFAMPSTRWPRGVRPYARHPAASLIALCWAHVIRE
jgi:hypothetical protein